MNIRSMTRADWPRMMEIYAQALEKGISTFQQTCPTYEDWDKAHRPDSRLIAEVDGTIAAWAVLAPTSARECYRGVVEVSIYVAEEFQHRGIGKKLMAALEEEAEKAGCWTLFSVVFEVNKPSLALHEACGFRTIGYRERIAKDRFGNWQNTIHLEKRL